MTSEDIRATLNSIVVDIFELEQDPAGLPDTFDLEQIGDSLQRLELIAAVEKEFNIPSDTVWARHFGELVHKVQHDVQYK